MSVLWRPPPATQIALQIVLITCGVAAGAAVLTVAAPIASRIRRRQVEHARPDLTDGQPQHKPIIPPATGVPGRPASMCALLPPNARAPAAADRAYRGTQDA